MKRKKIALEKADPSIWKRRLLNKVIEKSLRENDNFQNHQVIFLTKYIWKQFVLAFVYARHFGAE